MDDEDFPITPAMRAYLSAFDAWLRDQSDDRLADRKAALGDLTLEGADRDSVVKISSAMRRRRSYEGVLTSRQAQVLRLRCCGLGAKSIAVLLEISERTVASHFDDIRDRLRTGNPFVLARRAAQMGLLPYD